MQISSVLNKSKDVIGNTVKKNIASISSDANQKVKLMPKLTSDTFQKTQDATGLNVHIAKHIRSTKTNVGEILNHEDFMSALRHEQGLEKQIEETRNYMQEVSAKRDARIAEFDVQIASCGDFQERIDLAFKKARYLIDSFDAIKAILADIDALREQINSSCSKRAAFLEKARNNPVQFQSEFDKIYSDPDYIKELQETIQRYESLKV